ncbi:hypothetical protein HXX76_002074 [Chlamydomonas incerta]|uniref:Uncharacterized protein n=1 Tax=Chlamydomonas incerta TaxID=51695 RepID=A0A835WAD9_CHLIN|nr:hypothetical protein HXX76_002074 [Chlamydomonas incerta]|eukprot:KAG2443728.1 hypothetical protein HXX76_002074 [Chlamydomonas incerta]
MQNFGSSKYAQKLAAVVDRAEEEAFKACSSNPAMYEVALRKKLDKSREGIAKMLQQHAAHSVMAQQQQQHQQMQQPVPMVNQQPMMQVPQHMLPQQAQLQQAPMEPAPEQNDDGALFNDFLGTFVNAGGPAAALQQQQQQQQQQQAQQQMLQQAYGAQQQQPGAYQQQPAARPGQAPAAVGVMPQHPHSHLAGKMPGMPAAGQGYPTANVPGAGRALAPPLGFPGGAPGAAGAPGAMDAQSMYGGGGMVMPGGAGVPMQGQHPGAQQGQHAPNVGMAGGMPGQQMGYGGMPGQAPAQDPATMAATAAAAVQQQQQQQQQQHMNAAQAQYVQAMQQQQQQQAVAVAAAAVQQQQQQMAAARMASGATSPPQPGANPAGLAAAAAAANARKLGMPGPQTAPAAAGQASRPVAMQVPSPVPTQPGAYTAPGALGPQAGAAVPAAPAAAAAPGTEEPSNPAALEQEYWRLVGQLKTRQNVLRAQIEKYAKLEDQKANRSRRILLEAFKRCTVEPGSAESANYPITGNTLKLLSAVLTSLDSATGRARAPGAAVAAAQPVPPSLAEGGATNTPPTAQPQVAAAPVAVKQEPGVATAPAVVAPAPAAGSSGTSRAAMVAAAAVQGAVRRSIKIPRPGQSKAGAGAAEGGGATAGAPAAGTAAAVQAKQEAEAGAKPGAPVKLERSADSTSPAVDQVTRLLGLLAQPLPAATLRAHSSRGAADALNFDWDSLMPSLPAAACAQLTAAAAAAAAGAPAVGATPGLFSRPAIRARTVSVCRVAGLSYESAGAPDGPGSSLHGQASVATAGGLDGMRTQSLGSHGTSCNSLAALGVALAASGLATAGGAAGRGTKRSAPDGTMDADGDAAAQAVTPELKRRHAALEAFCAEAEEELKGAVSLRLMEGELGSVSGLEPDAWLVEFAAVDLSSGAAAGASVMDDDGHHGTAAAAAGAAGATGAASGPPWRRLRVCVPWDYPHAPPVPTFSSSDPAYSHPYGRAARLHFQTALQGGHHHHHHHHHGHSPHHTLLSLARAWRDAVARVSSAMRVQTAAAAAGPASNMPHSLTPPAIAV